VGSVGRVTCGSPFVLRAGVRVHSHETPTRAPRLDDFFDAPFRLRADRPRRFCHFVRERGADVHTKLSSHRCPRGMRFYLDEFWDRVMYVRGLHLVCASSPMPELTEHCSRQSMNGVLGSSLKGCNTMSVLLHLLPAAASILRDIRRAQALRRWV
jgi:hypothetical protein